MKVGFLYIFLMLAALVTPGSVWAQSDPFAGDASLSLEAGASLTSEARVLPTATVRSHFLHTVGLFATGVGGPRNDLLGAGVDMRPFFLAAFFTNSSGRGLSAAILGSMFLEAGLAWDVFGDEPGTHWLYGAGFEVPLFAPSTSSDPIFLGLSMRAIHGSSTALSGPVDSRTDVMGTLALGWRLTWLSGLSSSRRTIEIDLD